MAHSFTRITVAGTRKRANLLLPSDQPVGTLLPQVLALLEEPPADEASAKVLVTTEGTALEAGISLRQAAVLDGSSLLLCSAPDAPPAAEVYDVTDLVAGGRREVAGLWNGRHRLLAGSAFAAAAMWAGTELLLAVLAPVAAWWILLVLSLAGLGAGAAAGPPPHRSALTPALLMVGWLAAAGAVWHLHDDGRLGGSLGLAALALSALTVLGLAAVGLASATPRALFCGAGTLAMATGLWAAAAAIAGGSVPAAGLGTLGGILQLGLLPQLALNSSGLSGLDDQRARGHSLIRANTVEAVASAHHGLTLATAVTAVSLSVGLWLLGTDTGRLQWTMPLLLVLTLAVFLRARAFPLAAQRYALYLAAAAGLCALAGAALAYCPDQQWVVGLAMVAAAGVIAACLALALPEHHQARSRQLAKHLETVAVAAAVPLTAGLLGIFSRLLESFP
ncbi:type VII secretion integral membrane protein EccD [Arthrobacter sp. zg-ZUI100]|uniref:type VII secretion integral membrane protein EccD n=1 Tax=Arthrobacter jiangjiafuii TaxID=2817475 RepID=UPI001AEEBA10|nr:type VII secretion integral membrane protein EccD [Arthrobacter jiangjiafuii]MBP3037111.1 type VII secretion integral membrane protein EccD [Arthrobacter jiangjiafuii]